MTTHIAPTRPGSTRVDPAQIVFEELLGATLQLVRHRDDAGAAASGRKSGTPETMTATPERYV